MRRGRFTTGLIALLLGAAVACSPGKNSGSYDARGDSFTPDVVSYDTGRDLPREDVFNPLDISSDVNDRDFYDAASADAGRDAIPDPDVSNDLGYDAAPDVPYSDETSTDIPQGGETSDTGDVMYEPLIVRACSETERMKSADGTCPTLQLEPGMFYCLNFSGRDRGGYVASCEANEGVPLESHPTGTQGTYTRLCMKRGDLGLVCLEGLNEDASFYSAFAPSEEGVINVTAINFNLPEGDPNRVSRDSVAYTTSED